MGPVEVPKIEGGLVAVVEDGILVGVVGDDDEFCLKQIAGLNFEGSGAIDQIFICKGFKAVE